MPISMARTCIIPPIMRDLLVGGKARRENPKSRNNEPRMKHGFNTDSIPCSIRVSSVAGSFVSIFPWTGARAQYTINSMKLGLINSAWAQSGKDTAYGIRMTKEIGFDTIDIFTDPLEIDVKERRRIKRECDQAGLPIISLACVAVGLIDFNPSVQKFHLDRCRVFLNLAYEYEAKNLLLVLGEYIWEQQVIPP